MKNFILTFILCMIFSLKANTQSNWPMVSGNTARTAWVDTEELTPPLKLEYNIALSGEFMVKYEDALYFGLGGSPNSVKAWDMNQGEELWTFEIPGSAGSIGVVPAISDDKIFVGGQNGLGLYALNRHTGEEEWLKPIGTLFSRCPITDGLGHVYISSGDSLYCINESDGTTLWVSSESQGYCTPSLYDNKVFLDNTQKLLALDASNGNIIWQVMHISGPRSQILIDSSGLYMCKGSEICAYNTQDGSEKWCYSLPNGDAIASFTEGSATLSETTICFTIWENSEGKAQLVAINKENGQKLWDFTSDTYGISAPAAAGNTVYVTGYGNPWVRGFDLNDGSIVFEQTDENYTFQPIIADERLFISKGWAVNVFKADQSSNSNNIIKEEIICYPNPFDLKMTIELGEMKSQAKQIVIHQFDGKVIYSREGAPEYGIIEIPTGDLLPGIYYLTVETERESISKKLVKVSW